MVPTRGALTSVGAADRERLARGSTGSPTKEFPGTAIVMSVISSACFPPHAGDLAPHSLLSVPCVAGGQEGQSPLAGGRETKPPILFNGSRGNR